MNNEKSDIIDICQQNTPLNNLNSDLNKPEQKTENVPNDTIKSIFLKKGREKLSIIEVKRRKRECDRIYRKKNKDRINQNSKRHRRQESIEKKKARNRKYYCKHKIKINERARKWRVENRERSNKHRLNRKKTDINFKLSCALRTRLSNAVFDYNIDKKKGGSSIKDLGCTMIELKIYLEKQFTKGMNWENYGIEGWHIDHIIPISSFNLIDRKQFLQACHYTNLQPLWGTTKIAIKYGESDSYIGNSEKCNKII